MWNENEGNQLHTRSNKRSYPLSIPITLGLGFQGPSSLILGMGGPIGIGRKGVRINHSWPWRRRAVDISSSILMIKIETVDDNFVFPGVGPTVTFGPDVHVCISWTYSSWGHCEHCVIRWDNGCNKKPGCSGAISNGCFASIIRLKHVMWFGYRKVLRCISHNWPWHINTILWCDANNFV